MTPLNTRIRDEAKLDLQQAIFWYEQQKIGLGGLGKAFLQDVRSTLSFAAHNPNAYPLIYKNVQRAVLSDFPFSIFYLLQDMELIVLAVLHHRRNPNQWKNRLTT